MNIGSPKPEKRQANSPLPPPPSVSPDLTLHVHTAKNLDDMYAKVHKHKKKNDSDGSDSIKSKDKIPVDNSSTSSTSSSVSAEDKKVKETSTEGGLKEHNYETLRKSPRKCSDPGYEKIKSGTAECGSEPGYASINGPESIASSDPGYEVLRQNALSQTDPNYEELKNSASDGYSRINPSSKNVLDGYSVVNKPSSGKSGTSNSFESDTRDNFDEPNYESMPSETSEHNYAAVRSNDSESDPNYESVNHGDPNYESVKYLTFEDPPYERLQDDDSAKSEKVKDGYETVKTTNSQRKTEHSYEDVDTGCKGDGKEGSDDAAGYETIKAAAEGEFDDDGIVQV